METGKLIRLSLVSSLLVVLSGCGDNSSKVQEPNITNENNRADSKSAVIMLKGDSQVNIIQGSSFEELGATARTASGKPLDVRISGKVDTSTEGSYTLVYSATDSSGEVSTTTRVVQVLSATDEDVRNYYLTPIEKKSIGIANVDLISGEVGLSQSDIAGRGSLSLSRLYSSYDDQGKVAGSFKLNYGSSIDTPLAENIKSQKYATIESACIEGWRDIEGSAFLGKLENAQPIFNEVTSLCDIYDDGEILASLMTKHERSGKSNHLHTLTRPDGSTYVFFKKNNQWETISKAPFKLEETPTGFKLINLSDGIEEYNHEGRLLSLSNEGQVTTLNYSPRGELLSIVDPFGKSVTLSYSEEGLLTEATSYDETKVKYSYNNQKQLTQVTYEDGTTKSYSYNSNGDLESITDTNGVVSKSIEYDAEGKAIATAGVNGLNPMSLVYTDEKTVVKAQTGVTDYYFMIKNSRFLSTKRVTDEGIETTTYDSHGYPKLTTNRFGVVTKTTYDEEGLLVTKTTDADTPDQRIELTSYDVRFRKPTKVVKDGLVTFYDYDENGKTIQQVVATVVMPNSEKVSAKTLSTYSKATLKSEATQEQVTRFNYNDKGQVLESTQPNGGKSLNAYDAEGNLIKSTDALGYSTETLAFDKAGRPLKTKDYNDKISTTTYDNMGRVLKSTQDGETTTHEYDSSGRNIKTTYPDGRVEEKKYDQNGNVVESWNNQGDRTKSYYDDRNNLIKTETYKDGELTNKSETEYDSKNRVIANIDALGNRTTYTYNAKGQQTESRDALGRVTKSVYNAKGQLAQTINPDGKATTYTYNAEGQQTKVETPNGATFTFSYDSLQRVTAKGNPDRGTTTYSYDVSGNILTETNAKGEVKTYTYDIANRKISTSYSTDASLNESYEYDQGANAKGKLTKITDSSGSTEFAFDKDGNMVTKTETIGNQQFITSYSYDEHDRMTSMSYPSGKKIGYVYDDKGELVSLNIDGVPFISDIKTNDNGLLSYTYADGTKHTRTYDENGRVKELFYPNYTEKVNYNKVSNITNIQSDAMSRAFGYDNLDRLTSYEQNATDFQNFAYDANGNRLSQSQEENSSKTFDYLANSNILNTIQETKGTDTKEISYEYDATGNIIKDDKHTYSYDGRNRLTAIDNNVTYQYNYDNKRVSKTVNGVKTYFIYDGYKLIGEYELNINDERRQEMVYLNSTPIATVTSTGTYRIYADHLDTSRRVATNDEEAKVLWEWESKPFGESLANEDVDGDNKKFTLNLRFPGQYFDAETGTHYNINRDYNPVTGRYVQSDPIGFDGGLNSYAYVGGKPINLVDLFGEVEGYINWQYFIIQGGTVNEQWRIWNDLLKVVSTTRGNQMLNKLEERMYFSRDAWLWLSEDFIINLDIPTGKPPAYVPYLGANEMYINPDFHPLTHTTWGKRRSETFRIIAHELGHASFGDDDDDYMGQTAMRNVILNENPVATEVGFPARTRYYY